MDSETGREKRNQTASRPCCVTHWPVEMRICMGVLGLRVIRFSYQLNLVGRKLTSRSPEKVIFFPYSWHPTFPSHLLPLFSLPLPSGWAEYNHDNIGYSVSQTWKLKWFDLVGVIGCLAQWSSFLTLIIYHSQHLELFLNRITRAWKIW